LTHLEPRRETLLTATWKRLGLNDWFTHKHGRALRELVVPV